MSSKKKWLSVLILLVCMNGAYTSAFSQNVPNSLTSQTFKAKYPNAYDVNWEIDDHGNQEVHFKMKGGKFRADFTANGKWIETENSVDWSDLPSAVKKAVKKSFDKDDITEIEWVDHHMKGVFFDVEFKQKGKNLDIEFTTDGKRLN